ncbi:Aspartic proteinase-like protein 1 [Nymphaea thermarum]|nr:Aspartic proteinase-like protein 1 [Nymphaea thermarum]
MAVLSSHCLLSFTSFVLLVVAVGGSPGCDGSLTLSSKLIHRFSEEARLIWRRRNGEAHRGPSPRSRSLEYYEMLWRSDVQRQRMRLSPQYQSLLFSEGSETFSPGNDLGWLHYVWVDIGTPNVSFFVALDTGSDLFWVPCDCIQCATFAAQNFSLDRDLNMYDPAGSTTSKHLLCSDELCDMGFECKSQKQFCPYAVNYYSAGTSTSGLLVQDKLHLAVSNNLSSKSPIEATIVIGCGRKQTGDYLDGVAPNGVMGLGFGELSVPSSLAKAGLVRDSFSLCFQEDGSGRIVFGDQGLANQSTTPFVSSRGKYLTYIVEVESVCIGKTCLEQASFQTLVDSGSSFTFVPADVYKRVVLEFDARMNDSKVVYEGFPWEYCYKGRLQELPDFPKLTVMFANDSFSVQNPLLELHATEEDSNIFCLALQSTTDAIGVIGRRILNETKANDRPENSLPTDQQQSPPGGHAVSPAIAGWAPPAKPSAASSLQMPRDHSYAVFDGSTNVVSDKLRQYPDVKKKK